jgi:hypothetical protein
LFVNPSVTYPAIKAAVAALTRQNFPRHRGAESFR